LQLEPLMAAGMQVLYETELVELQVGGEYYWNVEGLMIDGREVPNPVRLERGSHVVQWEGEVPLILCVAPPGMWPTEF